MARHLSIFLIAALLTIGLARPAVHAQDAIGYTSIDTTPPGLRVVLLIDDSGTMQDGIYPAGGATLNSASTAGELPQGDRKRDTTDPNAHRWALARRLIDTLHADQNATHAVAVYSFADEVRRVSGSDSANPFVTLGVGASEADYTTLVTSAVSDYRVEPGKVLLAIETARDALRRVASSGSTATDTLKPLVLLIADDVPLESYGTSPWQQLPENTPWDNVFTPRVTETIRELKEETLSYRGTFCPSSEALFAVMALGAATWISSDGIIAGAGLGNYWDSQVSLDSSGTPMLAKLDPSFQDDTQMRAGMRAALDRFLQGVRCYDGVTPPAKLIDGTNHFTWDNADVFSSVRIIVEGLDGANVTVQTPGGATVSSATPGVRLLRRDGHQVWSLDGAALASDWTGTWTVMVGTTDSMRVVVQRDWRLSGITAQMRAPFNAEIGLQDMIFDFTIDGLPLADSEFLSLDLAIAGGTPEIRPLSLSPVPGERGAYFTTIEREDAATLELVPRVTLRQRMSGSNPPYAVDAPLELTLGTGLFEFTRSEIVARLNEPVDDTIITCPDGIYPAKVTVDQPGLAGVSPQNIGASTQVEIIARSLESGDVVVGALSFNPLIDSGGAFTGTITCSLLTVGEVELFARASTAGGASKDSAPRQISYPQPTATPSPTPIPTATFAPTATVVPPTPVPTSTPREPSPVDGAVTFATNPLVLVPVVVGAALLSLPLAWRGLLNALPLRAVIVQQTDPSGARQTRPLVAGTASWLPWRRRAVWSVRMRSAARRGVQPGTSVATAMFQDGDPPPAQGGAMTDTPIFEITIDADDAMRLLARVDLVVNGVRALRSGEVVEMGSAALTLESASGWQFKVIDQRAQARTRKGR